MNLDATPESQPHWDGLERGEYLVQRCAACGVHRHYPRPVCARCHSLAFAWVACSGRGTVHSWTVAHQALDPSVEGQVPYVMATVDLEEGVRMMGRFHEVAPSDLRIGLPVRITFEAADDGLAIAALRPA